MLITNTLNTVDLRNAMHLHFWSRMWAVFYLTELVLISAGGLLAGFTLIDVAIFVILFFATLYALAWFLLMRKYRATSWESMQIEIRADGFFTCMGHLSGTVPWTRFVGWKKNNKVVLLYSNRKQFKLVPARWFSTHEAFQQAVSTLSSNLGKPTT